MKIKNLYNNTEWLFLKMCYLHVRLVAVFKDSHGSQGTRACGSRKTDRKEEK